MKQMGKDVKFYMAGRCTRWDVYPQKEPATAVGHDWEGFWAFDATVGWYLTPTSFLLTTEITREAAEAFHRDRLERIDRMKEGSRVKHSDWVTARGRVPSYENMVGTVVEKRGETVRVHWDCDDTPDFGCRPISELVEVE